MATAKKKAPGKKKGAYTHKFDPRQIRKLREIQCTDVEIAAVLGCSVPTIERRKVEDPKFAEAYEAGTAKGRVSLRRQLWALSRSKSAKAVTAAIWLSKQYLGMRDVYRGEISGPDGAPVKMEFAESPAERIASKLALLATRIAGANPGGSKPEGSGGA